MKKIEQMNKKQAGIALLRQSTDKHKSVDSKDWEIVGIIESSIISYLTKEEAKARVESKNKTLPILDEVTELQTSTHRFKFMWVQGTQI